MSRLILALHKDLNLSRLVFALQKDFGLVITFWYHVTFCYCVYLAQKKNSRADVNCRTLLNFEKCISIHS